MDPFPIERSIPAAFETQVELCPGNLAVRSGGRTVTYEQLNRQANRLAREILTACPRDGEVIAGLFSPGESGITAFLATLKAGKIYLPLDPFAPSARIGQILRDSAAALLLWDGERVLLEIPALDIRELDAAEADDNLEIAVSPGAPASIAYTSGSTGLPKGVVHLHRNLLHNVRNHTLGYGVAAHDRILPNGPADILTALLNGASLFPFSWRKDGLAGLKERLLEDRITIWTAVPTTLRRFAASLNGTEKFPHLRLIKLSGETIFRRDVELCRKHFSSRCIVRPALAMTEAGMVCAQLLSSDAPLEDGIVPVGFPVEGKEILIFDEEGRPQPDGVPGEIAIRSRYLSAGYWRRPDLTAARFLPDHGARIYLTGDLGRRRPDGMYEHLGRRDSQVKIRANRVELAEVEAAMQAVDSVAQAAAVARPDAAGQLALYGYYTVSQPLSPASLRAQLRRRLPDYMVPAGLVALDEMPLLPNGKVNRAALPQASPVAIRELSPVDLPQTAAEKEVARLWCELLQLASAGRNDSFFDLGGDSLLAMEAAARMEKQPGVRISPATLASQTLLQIAAALSPCGAEPCSAAELPLGPPELEPFFLPVADRRLWCVFHPPASGRPPRSGILICQPFGWEYYASHQCLRRLAQRLAQSGFAVLRFDYSSTGDSSGESEEARLEDWRADIASAAVELERRGAPCGCLIGLRLGATLAATHALRHAGLAALVLWEPVTDGTRYLRELQARQKTEVWGSRLLPGELMGVTVPPELRADLDAVRLPHPERLPVKNLLLLDAGSVAEPGFWNVRGNRLALAPRTVNRIVEWVERTCP